MLGLREKLQYPSGVPREWLEGLGHEWNGYLRSRARVMEEIDECNSSERCVKELAKLRDMARNKVEAKK